MEERENGGEKIKKKVTKSRRKREKGNRQIDNAYKEET